MDEPGRKSMTEWWRGLSGAWRLNGLLYVLAVVALVVLVAEVVSGGGETPKRVQVASRQSGRTTTTRRVPLTTTSLATSTTVAGPTTTAASSGPAGGGVASAPQRSGGGASAPAPLAAPPAPSGGTGNLVCLNSKNPACGPFRWQTDPGGNQPVSVSVDPPAAVVAQNHAVTFSVTVADPDHGVTANCGVVQFGDGAVAPLNCNRPSESACQSSYGPYVTPPKVDGRQLFKFTHVYGPGGPYSASFSFGTDQDACPDPYGSPAMTAVVQVTVLP